MLNIVHSPHWKLYHLNNHMRCLLCQATLHVKDVSFSHFLTHLSGCYFSYWITWFSSIWMVNYIIAFYVYMTTSVYYSFLLSQSNNQWNARHQHHRHHHLLPSLLSQHYLSAIMCTFHTFRRPERKQICAIWGRMWHTEQKASLDLESATAFHWLHPWVCYPEEVISS